MWEPKVSWSCDSFRKRSWIPSMPGIHVVIHVGTHSHPSKSWWLCMHACMHVCMCVYVCMYVWMDGWMDGCMHACMYVCMHTCMHVCMYASMHVCIYASMHLCMHACMYACMYACMHACMHACMYVHRDMFKWPESKGFWCVKRWLDHPNHILWGSTKSHAYICIYIYTYICTYIINTVNI